jgi:hypothetical protein
MQALEAAASKCAVQIHEPHLLGRTNGKIVRPAERPVLGNLHVLLREFVLVDLVGRRDGFEYFDEKKLGVRPMIYDRGMDEKEFIEKYAPWYVKGKYHPIFTV